MSEHKRLTQSLEQTLNILNNNNLELVSKISGYESRIKEIEEENEKMKKCNIKKKIKKKMLVLLKIRKIKIKIWKIRMVKYGL